jgi:peptidoglycan hydrolase CwlO-like protein
MLSAPPPSVRVTENLCKHKRQALTQLQAQCERLQKDSTDLQGKVENKKKETEKVVESLQHLSSSLDPAIEKLPKSFDAQLQSPSASSLSS